MIYKLQNCFYEVEVIFRFIFVIVSIGFSKWKYIYLKVIYVRRVVVEKMVDISYLIQVMNVRIFVFFLFICEVFFGRF